MQKINISFVGEFGYEMILSVPYAYYLHVNNMLGTTVSSKDTKCFYYFSKLHEEKFRHFRDNILQNFTNFKFRSVDFSESMILSIQKAIKL